MTLLSRLPDKLTRSARSLLYAMGSEKSLYRFQEQKDVVIMYHNILPDFDYDLNFRNISVHDFRKTLIYLKKNFEVISLEEMMRTKSTTRRVAITFDDGLLNNIRCALPVLEEQKVHATFFITTFRTFGVNLLWPDLLSRLLQRVDGEIEFAQRKFQRSYKNQFTTIQGNEKLESFLLNANQSEIELFIEGLKQATGFAASKEFSENDFCRVMNDDEIAILSKSSYAEVGSHCVTHRNLARLGNDDLMMELKKSKGHLEQICERRINMIAFPFGIYSAEILKACEEVGYKNLVAVSAIQGVDTTGHHLCFRLGLYNDSSLVNQLHLINKSFE